MGHVIAPAPSQSLHLPPRSLLLLRVWLPLHPSLADQPRKHCSGCHCFPPLLCRLFSFQLLPHSLVAASPSFPRWPCDARACLGLAGGAVTPTGVWSQSSCVILQRCGFASRGVCPDPHCFSLRHAALVKCGSPPSAPVAVCLSSQVPPYNLGLVSPFHGCAGCRRGACLAGGALIPPVMVARVAVIIMTGSVFVPCRTLLGCEFGTRTVRSPLSSTITSSS
ncbi:hypothetical protein B0H13DRAFT_2350090 [Mycena leptocephala]|nr:hypothetical protein B0H13DRAFT_2350090 [Mycena leptocephala]